MKSLAAFLLVGFACFMVTRNFASRPTGAVESVRTPPLATLPRSAETDRSEKTGTPSEAALLARELAHRAGPSLLPPHPFQSDGSLSPSLARILGLPRTELENLNNRLREIGRSATEARMKSAKLVMATDRSAAIFAPRQVSTAQALESDYVTAITHAIGPQLADWLGGGDSGTLRAAARQATRHLGSTDTTWTVQKVDGATPNVSVSYALITVLAQSADNFSQSSTFFDKLESLDPIAREVLQRNLPPTFLGGTP